MYMAYLYGYGIYPASIPTVNFTVNSFVSFFAYFYFALFTSFAASCGDIQVLHRGQSHFLQSTSVLAQTETPVIVVEKLHNALVEVMKNAHLLGWQGRYDQLQDILRHAYDFSGMTRIAVGSHWKAFTEPQKVNMIEAFSRLSIATYASRFNRYGGERFETIEVEKIPQSYSSVIVRTRLLKKDGSDVELSYRLRVVNEIWKIVDVFYRGTISELANQRAQYLTVLNQSGYERLLKRLDEKVHKLAIKGQEAINDVP